MSTSQTFSKTLGLFVPVASERVRLAAQHATLYPEQSPSALVAAAADRTSREGNQRIAAHLSGPFARKVARARTLRDYAAVFAVGSAPRGLLEDLAVAWGLVDPAAGSED